jgi:hypothetical protein
MLKATPYERSSPLTALLRLAPIQGVNPENLLSFVNFSAAPLWSSHPSALAHTSFAAQRSSNMIIFGNLLGFL